MTQKANFILCIHYECIWTQTDRKRETRRVRLTRTGRVFLLLLVVVFSFVVLVASIVCRCFVLLLLLVVVVVVVVVVVKQFEKAYGMFSPELPKQKKQSQNRDWQKQLTKKESKSPEH